MAPRTLLYAALLASMTATCLAFAAETGRTGALRLSANEIDALPAKHGGGAGTSHAGGMLTTMIYCDPARPGLYTIRIRIPPHTSIKPHTHRDTRAAVVVSGTWYFGYGRQFNPAALKALPAGSFYTETANTAHFAQTGDEAAVVFITGYGPTDTVYVNPADDPSRP
jgi:quercetin dioxygenase-like cupin family protein